MVTDGSVAHCLRIGQSGHCYNKSHCCLVGGLSCAGSAVPFYEGSFYSKDIIRSALSFLEPKVIAGERETE
jgi:hypothetical protein